MVGIDIIEIARIEKSLERSSFLRSIYTENEIAYYNGKAKKAETLAGMFCVKEAVAKALGTGFKSFKPADVEVCHNENGAPYVKLYNAAAEIFNKNFANKNIAVSVSHNFTTATAICFIN